MRKETKIALACAVAALAQRARIVSGASARTGSEQRLPMPIALFLAPKSDGYAINVYFKDFTIGGVEANSTFTLKAEHLGKAGIANPLSSGTGTMDPSKGNWTDQMTVTADYFGQINVRLRNMTSSNLGEPASVLFTMRDGAGLIAASQSWTVTADKPSGPKGGYYSDPGGPTGFVGKDAWRP